VTRQYIQSLGRNSAETAELSGRVQVGFQDVLTVLGSSRLKDSRWQDLREFASPSNGSQGWNQPFPYDVPTFPKASKKSYTSNDSSSSSTRAYVPTHLPPFPPSHTYKMKAGKRKAEKLSDQDNQQKKAKDAVQPSASNTNAASNGGLVQVNDINSAESSTSTAS
jgi:hypothetical protein